MSVLFICVYEAAGAADAHSGVLHSRIQPRKKHFEKIFQQSSSSSFPHLQQKSKQHFRPSSKGQNLVSVQKAPQNAKGKRPSMHTAQCVKNPFFVLKFKLTKNLQKKKILDFLTKIHYFLAPKIHKIDRKKSSMFFLSFFDHFDFYKIYNSNFLLSFCRIVFSVHFGR